MRPPRRLPVVGRLLERVGPSRPGSRGGQAAADAVADRDRSRDPRATAPALRVEPHPDVENPVLTAADVDDVADPAFVADPFVVRAGGRYHLFFEVKSLERRWLGLRGSRPRFDLAHATSPDGLAWAYRGVVLPAEQAEHTYPYVFRHDDDWLMTPSPAGDTPREFRVYRADPFPDEWTLVDRALTGEVRIDPTPFEFEGTWYLPYQEAGSFDVRLRYADALVDGEWREHPDSPLFTPGGNDVAQGGRPVVRDGFVDLLFRRGDPGVVEAWRLTELSRTALELRELPTSPVVSGSGRPGAWDGRNMHHVDAGPAVSSGNDLVAVDGQDDDRDYRIGVYARRDPGTVAVTLTGPRVAADGERLRWTDREADVGGAITDEGRLVVPMDGHYRFVVRLRLRAPVADRCTLSLLTSADADALADSSVHVAGTGETRARLDAGPVHLDRGTEVGVHLRQNGGEAGVRPVDGRLRGVRVW